MDDVDKIVKKFQMYSSVRAYLYMVGIYIGLPFLIINVANHIGGWIGGVMMGIIYYVLIYILHKRILELTKKIFELSQNPKTAKTILEKLKNNKFTQF